MCSSRESALTSSPQIGFLRPSTAGGISERPEESCGAKATEWTAASAALIARRSDLCSFSPQERWGRETSARRSNEKIVGAGIHCELAPEPLPEQRNESLATVQKRCEHSGIIIPWTSKQSPTQQQRDLHAPTLFQTPGYTTARVRFFSTFSELNETAGADAHGEQVTAVSFGA